MLLLVIIAKLKEKTLIATYPDKKPKIKGHYHDFL